MQVINESVEAKQDLLRREIYEKGYDCDRFQTYMDELKPNGVQYQLSVGGQEIEIWTIPELRDAIRHFQNHNQVMMTNIELDAEFSNDRNSQVSHPEKEQQENGEIKINQDKSNEQIEQYQEIVTKPMTDIDKLYHKKMDCIQQEQKMTMLIDNLTITITKYERIPGGIFTSAYFTYNIVTEPIGWNVMRRYSDFVWLREILSKVYPGNSLPPLPNKSVFKNQYELYLNKRMKFLQKFLDTLFKHNTIKHDKWFVAFISIKEEKDFKHVQQLSNNIIRISKLDQVATISGQVELIINDNINTYNKESQNLLGQMELQYKKLRKEAKQLLLDFDQTSNTIFNMGESCSNLYQLSNSFNQTISIGKLPQMDVLYIALNNMLVQWGNNITVQIQVVQDDLCNFLKFYNHQIIQLKEFTKQREQAFSEFERYKSRLELKKLKLFQSLDYQRWEVSSQQIKSLIDNKLNHDQEVCMALMLPKETSILEDLRNVYAFYNNQCYQEVNQTFKDNIQIFINHFCSFSNTQKQILAEQKTLWDQVILNLTSLNNQDGPKLTVSRHPL